MDRNWNAELQPEDLLIASMLYRAGVSIATISACFQLSQPAVAGSLYAEMPPKSSEISVGKAFRGFCGCVTFARDGETAWHRLFSDHVHEVPRGRNPRQHWTVKRAAELDGFWNLQAEPTAATWFAMGSDVQCPVCDRTMHRPVDVSPTAVQVGGLGEPVVPTPILGSKADATRSDRRNGSRPAQKIDAVWGVQEVVCKPCWAAYAELLPGLTAIRRRRLADFIAEEGQEESLEG